jgi:hypothetical protein
MNIFKTRFGYPDSAWLEWRNEQIEAISLDTVSAIGQIATRQDPKPYSSSSEVIEIQKKHVPIDLLSQGI